MQVVTSATLATFVLGVDAIHEPNGRVDTGGEDPEDIAADLLTEQGLIYTRGMTAFVRIRPELITEHRMRMEMTNLEDEDIENTVRMKGWAWVLARKSWVYAGEPDFIYRQIREVVIGLPDIAFDEASIEEGVQTVLEKARNPEEREEGRALLKRALEKTGQQERAGGLLDEGDGG